MAAPLSAARLTRALEGEGVRVVEHQSWRTHNRNHKGAWGPVHGVMMHHTVTAGTARSVQLCYGGHEGLPGPLCHGVVAKDGTVYLVGNGRANHAGLGDGDVLRAVIAEESLPAHNAADTDGNARFYGFECVNLGDGKDSWPRAQYVAMVRAAAAICRAHGWGERSVIGHLEWQPGKVDPRGPLEGGGQLTMSGFRRDVAACLAAPAGQWAEDEELDMDKGDLFDAVWKQDKAPAPSTSGTLETNPTWAPINLLRELYDRVRELSAKVDELNERLASGAATAGEPGRPGGERRP